MPLTLKSFPTAMANFSQKCHKKLEENGEKWGKMGNLFYGESGKQIGKFPIFPHLFPIGSPPILGVTFLVKQRVRVNTCTNLCRNGLAYW